MEGFEQQLNLSAEQQEKFDAFLETVRPLVVQLQETNDSSFAETIVEETEKFKADINNEGIVMSDQQIDTFIKGLLDFQEAA